MGRCGSRLGDVRRQFPGRRSLVSGFRPRSSRSRSAGICVTGSRIATSRSWWPSGVSRLITSRSTGGCNGSPPLLADAARFARHSPGDRWFVDETYVKVAGVWRYVYRAIDQHGQVVDVLVSRRRDGEATHRFFQRALTTLKSDPPRSSPTRHRSTPRMFDELIPAAWHHVEQ